MQHREFDLLALLMVMLVELEWGVKLLGFLLLLLWGGGLLCSNLSTLLLFPIVRVVYGTVIHEYGFGRNYCA